MWTTSRRTWRRRRRWDSWRYPTIGKNTLNLKRGSRRSSRRRRNAPPEQIHAAKAAPDLPPEHGREDERRHDGRVALGNELGRVDAELAPSDFLVRHRARIAAVARGGVADLAEISPERHVGALQILVQHRHNADGEIARDAATDLEEPDAAAVAGA